jgi:hypothetical protein
MFIIGALKFVSNRLLSFHPWSYVLAEAETPSMSDKLTLYSVDTESAVKNRLNKIK